MREFTVDVDEMTVSTCPEALPFYMIALKPSGRRGAMATKRYFTKECLVHDLQQRLHYTDGAVERLFAGDKHQKYWRGYLSEEDAVCLGWLSDFDHNYRR